MLATDPCFCVRDKIYRKAKAHAHLTAVVAAATAGAPLEPIQLRDTGDPDAQVSAWWRRSVTIHAIKCYESYESKEIHSTLSDTMTVMMTRA